MGLVCLQPPQVEPVSLAELKEFLRIDAGDTSQDLTIQELALDARAFCETFSERKFVQQQWQLLMDFFPGYIDLKLAGAKVSSPFVSGSNAVLVGIRYGVVLPYPPVRTLDAFVYQNANGQVTSMIQGPVTIASVTNPSGQPIQLTTSAPHNLVSGGGVQIAGNSQLLSVLNGTSFQVITVLDPTNFLLNGTTGTGSGIAGGGTITGFNFVQDLLSNPARLTPVYGQVWPVARVVVNAVQVSFTVGYALPVILTAVSGQVGISTSTYNFQASDVGRPIWIPGGGSNGGDLNTIIASLGNTSQQANLRDKPGTNATNVTGLLVNQGKPEHWAKIKRGIKVMTLGAYENRMPRKELEDSVSKILYPVRDFRL